MSTVPDLIKKHAYELTILDYILKSHEKSLTKLYRKVRERTNSVFHQDVGPYEFVDYVVVARSEGLLPSDNPLRLKSFYRTVGIGYVTKDEKLGPKHREEIRQLVSEFEKLHREGRKTDSNQKRLTSFF